VETKLSTGRGRNPWGKPLLDHLIDDGQQLLGDGEAEGLGGFEVDLVSDFLGGRRLCQRGPQSGRSGIGGARGVDQVLGRIARGRARNVDNRGRSPSRPRSS
jgi:hypothetical protein